MDETRQRTVLRRIYLTYGLVALGIYCLLMGFVFPWWHAANHPVVVTMGAGSAQAIELAFAGDETPLKLAPIRQTGGYVSQWATELPPRASYELALVFPEGTVGEVVLKDLEVIRLAPEKTGYHLDYASIELPEDGSVRIQEIASGHRIFAEPGGRLPLAIALPVPTPYQWVATWARASLGFLVVTLALFLLIATLLRFPDGILAFRKRLPAAELVLLLVLALAGSLAHVYLVRHSVPVFTPGESERYLLEAISQQQDLTPETMPPARVLSLAYPLLVGTIAGLTEWDMSNVTLVQAVLFCFSVCMLALGMARLVQAYWVGPLVLLALLSPPAIWASRHIGIESTQASSVLLALASFLFLWQRDRWARWAGWVLFGLFTTWAVATSLAGLILLVLPVSLLAGATWWSYSIRSGQFWKLPVFWLSLGQASIPFAMLLVTCLLSSQSILPGPGRCVFSRSFSGAPFMAGLFDVRGITDPAAYESFLNEREQSGYASNPDDLTDYPEIVRSSVELLPWRVVLMAWGRLSAWGLFLPDIRTYDQRSLVTGYAIANGPRSASEAEAVREEISGLMRQTGVAVHVLDRHSNKHIVLYNRSLVPIYPWFYKLLFLFSMVGWLIGLMERKFLAAVLVMPYLLNIFLHIFMLNVSSQGIQSLDALLWFSALAGLLAANPKSMQKATEEGDRRCLAPIRPKRLLTRYNTPPPMRIPTA